MKVEAQRALDINDAICENVSECSGWASGMECQGWCWRDWIAFKST